MREREECPTSCSFWIDCGRRSCRLPRQGTVKGAGLGTVISLVLDMSIGFIFNLSEIIMGEKYVDISI